MRNYTLTIYWWFEQTRSNGGDYQFVAAGDDEAIAYARDHFDEPICMADQSAIYDEGKRLIWENEWPISPVGRQPHS